MSDEHVDAIVIGSGFGGAMAAWELVRAGKTVRMIERGGWIERGPHNWSAEGSRELTPAYSAESPYRIASGDTQDFVGSFNCVGGPSVFFGGVAIRFREDDFLHAPEIVGASGAAWPYRYRDLEPYYERAEHLLGVAGTTGDDPTEPPRHAPYPHAPAALHPVSARIADAARGLGLHPSPLPLAIQFGAKPARQPCIACTTCDGFACAISAKNDIATTMIPELLRRGLRLETETVAVRLVERDGHIASVDCVDKRTNRVVRYRARNVVLAAGALATPHLLLASGLERHNSGASSVGRYLMRHRNSAVLGVFPRRPNPQQKFHKQLAIMDFYFGHCAVRSPEGRLGSLQQFAPPPVELVRPHAPRWLSWLTGPWLTHLTGLLAIAEDQPQAENGVTLDRTASDRFGLPQLVIRHRYSTRDEDACRALVRQAKRILRRAGAWGAHVHAIRTFSHAVGTVRMGIDPRQSALDGDCRFRGIANLIVTDGSVMPTSAALNPSLTIAAIALRAAERLAHDPARWSRHHAFALDAGGDGAPGARTERSPAR